MSWSVNEGDFEAIVASLNARNPKGGSYPERTLTAFELEQPQFFTDEAMMYEWAGRSIPWFLMEVLIFVFYGSTMVILLIKSRFVTVGIDSSYQFEPVYMQKMANMIAENIDLDITMAKRNYD